MATLPAVQITQVLNVGIPVRDQARALEFYRDVLGMEVRRDGRVGEIPRWIELGPRGATVNVALVQSTQPAVDTGIRLATPDARAAHAALKQHGVEVSDLIFWDGVPPMFEMHDRDGNTLYVVESG